MMLSNSHKCSELTIMAYMYNNSTHNRSKLAGKSNLWYFKLLSCPQFTTYLNGRQFFCLDNPILNTVHYHFYRGLSPFILLSTRIILKVTCTSFIRLNKKACRFMQPLKTIEKMYFPHNK
jgi:hypothetical protein